MVRKMYREKTIILSALAAFLFLAGAWVFGAENISAQAIDSNKAVRKTEEITIRNTTREIIRYTIKEAEISGSGKTMTLEPGVVHRFPGHMPMDVEYYVNGKLMTNRLDPGSSYAFRYNEDHELELFLGSHGRTDAADLAPFLATPMIIADKMLQLARVDRDDVVYDLGCGDGRIVILAAKKYGARGVGIDIDPERIMESRTNAKKAGVEGLVEFRLEDVMKADFSRATLVTLYLIPESNEILRPHLERQLKLGTYVVSHNYHIPGWEYKEIKFVTIKDEEGQEHSIYVYVR